MLALVSGKRGVIDALNNDLPIETLYMTRDFQRKNALVIPKKVSVLIVTSEELEKLTGEANHQGVAARLSEAQYSDLAKIKKDRPRLTLVLDHIVDPQNYGAILRSANAFGVKHIIVPADRAAAITSTVLRVSSGGYIGINIVRVTSLQVALSELKAQHFWVYASNLDPKSKPINKIAFSEPAILIVGNEEKGVSKTLLNLADEHFYIPMNGTVQSLNVSVATGIMLYAFTWRSE